MPTDGCTPLLAVHVDFADGTAVIRLRGDLDVTTVTVLSDHLAVVMDKKPDRLIFDLAGAEFMDCAAAGVIFEAARLLPDGQQPVIRGAGLRVRRLLEVTGLDTQCIWAGPGPQDASADAVQV